MKYFSAKTRFAYSTRPRLNVDIVFVVLSRDTDAVWLLLVPFFSFYVYPPPPPRRHDDGRFCFSSHSAHRPPSTHARPRLGSRAHYRTALSRERNKKNNNIVRYYRVLCSHTPYHSHSRPTITMTTQRTPRARPTTRTCV